MATVSIQRYMRATPDSARCSTLKQETLGSLIRHVAIHGATVVRPSAAFFKFQHGDLWLPKHLPVLATHPISVT